MEGSACLLSSAAGFNRRQLLLCAHIGGGSQERAFASHASATLLQCKMDVYLACLGLLVEQHRGGLKKNICGSNIASSAPEWPYLKGEREFYLLFNGLVSLKLFRNSCYQLWRSIFSCFYDTLGLEFRFCFFILFYFLPNWQKVEKTHHW